MPSRHGLGKNGDERVKIDLDLLQEFPKEIETPAPTEG